MSVSAIQHLTKYVSCTVFVVAVAWFCAATPMIAHAAPAEVPVINDQQLTSLVAQHKGKVVVINFFASWCPPCREEIPGLLRLNKAYKSDKVVFLGVSVDEDKNALQRFVSQVGFTYPIYRAKDDISYKYGISSIPHNTVYDQTGKLVANQAGFVEEADLKTFLDSLLVTKK